MFADAGLPTGGVSRLAQLREEAPQMAAEVDRTFAPGGSFPDWSDHLLAQFVTDPTRRARLIAGIRRLPSEYWTEPIPAVEGWAETPCAALLLSDGYAPTARAAREGGWPSRVIAAHNHFLGVEQPQAVAEALLSLAEELA